jgi:hypothetical protein
VAWIFHFNQGKKAMKKILGWALASLVPLFLGLLSSCGNSGNGNSPTAPESGSLPVVMAQTPTSVPSFTPNPTFDPTPSPTSGPLHLTTSTITPSFTPGSPVPQNTSTLIPSPTLTLTPTATGTPTPLQPVATWGQYGDYNSSPASGAGYFNNPYGVAVGAGGNIYVSDSGNNRIQVFTSTGAPVTMWGQYGNYESSPATGAGYFNMPLGVAVDKNGNVYVVDSNNDRIQEFTSTGTPVTMWGQYGSYQALTTGLGYLNGPEGVAVDGSGNISVVDSNNFRVETFNSSYTPVSAWVVGQPNGVAVSGSDLYVTGDFRVGSIFKEVGEFTSAGATITTWGPFGSSEGQFEQASGVALDSTGNVYVTDIQTNDVQEFTSGGGVTLALWGLPGSGPGDFNEPTGVAIDSSNNIYVADYGNSRIEKYAPP